MYKAQSALIKKRVHRMPSIAKNRLLRKEYRKHLLNSLQKTKSLQTSGPVSAERIEQVEETKYALELLKTVDCFLDDCDSYSNNLVTFEIKSF